LDSNESEADKGDRESGYLMATVWLERHDCVFDRLPGLCLKCGRGTDQRVSKRFYRIPRWVFLTVLIHPVIFVLVAIFTHKRRRLRVPMCHDHQNHWLHRRLIVGVTLVLLVAASIGLGQLTKSLPRPTEELVLVTVIPAAILLWVILVVALRRTAVRAKQIGEQGVQMTGVSDEFVRAYLEQCQARASLPDLDRVVSERWGERQRRETPEQGGYKRDEGYQEDR
jgi:hypothetical protein